NSVLYAALAIFCILGLGRRPFSSNMTLTTPLLCGISFLAIQVLAHGGSLMQDYTRPMVIWIASLIIVKSLSKRAGFIGRFNIAILVICLSAMPYFVFDYKDTGRAGLDPSSGVVLANPNDLAAWFGFCAVAFAVRSLETRRLFATFMSWAITL